MLLSSIPNKFAIPFASSAGGSYIRTVPQTPTGTPGQASLQQGFPPENFNPVASGGVPPFGQDFNGLLNQITAWNRFAGAGVAAPPYDSTFQTAVGGYPKTAIVSSLVTVSTLFMSIVDNNLTNPDAGGAGWIIFFQVLLANTDVYVNGSTGNDANNGLSPSTAKATIQAGLNLAYSYPPSPFTITIHIAAGTYNENPVSPSFPASNIIVSGAGTASTFIHSTSSALFGFTCQGPTNIQVQNVAFTGAAINGLVYARSSVGEVTNVSFACTSAAAQLYVTSNASCTITGNTIIAAGGSAVFTAGNCGTMIFAQSVNVNISTGITVGLGFVYALINGNINVQNPGPPSFTNPGNVTGPKYDAVLNGVISAGGLGTNFFPGSSAGSTSTGGQYLP